jgi:hypothetical protein
MKEKFLATAEMNEVLRRSGSNNPRESETAMAQIVQAVTDPIRNGVMSGDIWSDIFTTINLEPGSVPEFPLGILQRGTEKDYVAYTIPQHGAIPERRVESDYILVPTFSVANSIDWLLKHARNARWDIVGSALQLYRDGFTQKFNDDAFHTLLAAIVDRNILIYDSTASAGQFTKRLVSLAKTAMRRNGGGNSTSTNRRKLTDLYMSPEGVEDIRNWSIADVDEYTRREIYTMDDGTLNRIFNVNIHDLDELGENQSYQLYFTEDLTGTLETSDVELAIGLDLSVQNCFVRPLEEDIQMFDDPTLHRRQKAGVYGWSSYGLAVLDGSAVIGMSF